MAKPTTIETEHGAVELHLRKDTGLKGEKRYDVVLNGQTIGRIDQFYPTFEQKIPGKRYVARRWKSKRVHWVADYPGRRHNMYRGFVETRKEAVGDVLRGWEAAQQKD